MMMRYVTPPLVTAVIVILLGLAAPPNHPTAPASVVAQVVPPNPDPKPEPKPPLVVPITPATPTIELPEKVLGDVGAFITVAAKTNGREVRWFPATGGLNVFPAEMLRDSRSTVVTAARAGEYRLAAYTALGDMPSTPAFTTVIVGTPTPPQPGPGPGPAPVPPPDIPTPSAELQRIMTPVKAVMDRADRGKAAIFARAWSDFHAVMKTAGPPKSTGAFKEALQTFINAAATREGLTGAFPGFTVATETAFVSYFTAEDATLDATKALDFVAALAWACGGGK